MVINYTAAPNYNIALKPVNTYRFQGNNISASTDEWFHLVKAHLLKCQSNKWH